MAMGGDALRDQATFLISQDDAQRRMLLPSLEASFGPTLGAATRRWAQESIAAVDHLLTSTLKQPLSDVAAAVDFSRLAYAGMSLGGSVALACCFLDPRARAGINLDGSNWCQEYLDLDVPVPFLQLYADPSANMAMLKEHARAGTEALSALTPGSRLCNDMFYEPPRRRGLRNDVLRVVLRDTAHMSFSDHALAARGPVRKLLGTGSSNGRRQQWLQAQLALGFLARHLKGRDDPAMASVLIESPELVRQRLEPESASKA
jgi:pimeloyl-ACP methyl ester carboxylesterase